MTKSKQDVDSTCEEFGEKKREKDEKSYSGPVEYNVTQRPVRSTAGNRYAKLLQGELEKQKDDFYQQTYGGFNEEDNDNDFEGEGLEDEDVLDSDFNTSEEGEGDDEREDEEKDGVERKKKTKRLVTRAYKEPKKVKSGDNSQKKVKAKSESKEGVTITTAASDIQLRQSTKDRREDTVTTSNNAKQPAVNRSKRKLQEMSQEERLKAAELMEAINKESLEKFLKLEEEKKEKRQIKKPEKGPQITFKSFTVKNDANNEDTKQFNTTVGFSTGGDPNRFSQNVVIFPDTSTLKNNFPNCDKDKHGAETKKPRLICPITRQPAKYFDPLTQQPYSSMSAFKVLRQIYKLKLSLLHSTKTVYPSSSKD